MNELSQQIHNSIDYLAEVNGQIILCVGTTISNETQSFTSLGGAVGTANNTNDFNNLLNQAVKSSYQNIQLQQPRIQGLQVSAQQELPVGNNSHQNLQNTSCMPKQQLPLKQAYTKPHSTTRTASTSQQSLIKNLCHEKGLNIEQVLAPYGKSLSTITSAIANEIIQQIRNK